MTGFSKWRQRALTLALGLATVLCTLSLEAQVSAEQRLRQHADSLERIRQERAQLEAQMRQMQGRARSLSDEVSNLARQSATTARVVQALDLQLGAINAEVVASAENLVRAQDELLVKRADLRKRLTDIYKRGPLHTLEVLFSAKSFTDLIARYKYLHLQTVRDRAMLKRVSELRDDIEGTRQVRLRLQEDVGRNLAEKAREEERFRTLEAQRKQTLAQVQQSTTQTQQRLAQIAADERRLNSLMEVLDREARATGGRGTIAGTSAFRAGAGLEWPVAGEIIYRFGRVTGTNLTETRQNGIGVSAPRGAAVRAVANGRVEYAAELAGYGLTVVVLHAGGDYTIYGSLERISVAVGATVTRAQTIGTVGSNDSSLGTHLHFEVRLNSPSQPPRAVDPLPFLRPPRQ